MRTGWLVLAMALLPATAWAQDTRTPPAERDDSTAAAEPSPAAAPATDPDATSDADAPTTADADADAPVTADADAPVTSDADAPATSDAAPTAAPSPRIPPKVVLVIVGDPDPVLQAAALEIEAQLALAGTLRLPSDPALRGALRGDSGGDEDGLEEVRRERRRLGLGEPSDTPILQRLGRRAGAVLVVAVREGPAGPEAVALDVSSGQFFEGTLALADPPADTIAPFVARRARVAARGAAATARGAAATARGAAPAADEPAGPAVPAAATEAEPPQERDWFEVNWPYFAAGALLVAAIVFVVVTATEGGEPPPMLRFQPGAP